MCFVSTHPSPRLSYSLNTHSRCFMQRALTGTHTSPAYLNSASTSLESGTSPSAPCGRLSSNREETTAPTDAHASMEPHRSRHACSTRRCTRGISSRQLAHERSRLSEPVFVARVFSLGSSARRFVCRARFLLCREGQEFTLFSRKTRS